MATITRGRRQIQRRGRVLKAGLVAALTAAVLPLSATQASAVPCAPNNTMDYVGINTLHVDIGKFAKTYKKGEKVPVKVKVTRPSENDPMGLGFTVPRPVTQPAEDVNVGVGLSIGRVFLPGYTKTNAKGEGTAWVKLENYTPVGKWAAARAYAYQERANTPCLIIEEQGFRDVARAFKVVI
jgi:hypothetical protein